MEFLSEYGLFLAKVVTSVAAILIILAAGAAAAAKAKKDIKEGSIKVTHLNKKLDEFKEKIKEAVEDEHSLKLARKQKRKQEKLEAKQKKKAGKNKENIIEPGKPRIYVMDFIGDPKASQVESLRRVITAILTLVRPDQDQILLRLESPGGMVHAYGLAASQLQRIRQRNIPLTICVDKVAASGGYMMACLGNKIIAAPFAYIGSIGVLLQLPNFNRLLKDKNIDFEMITAGEYKRTLTIFGENTDKDRAKVTEEIQEIHDQFKDFVKEHRPSLNIDEVATGETWFGRHALERNLIDEIKTSDECIVEACEFADVYAVAYEEKKKLSDKLGKMAEAALDNTLHKWLQKSSRDHTS